MIVTGLVTYSLLIMQSPKPFNEKKRSHEASLQSLSSHDVAPSLCLLHSNSITSPRWEDISLPNGPMLLLKGGGIGGRKSHERLLTRKTISSLPDWNENVTFKMFGKVCQMRRVSTRNRTLVPPILSIYCTQLKCIQHKCSESASIQLVAKFHIHTVEW